MIILQNTMSPVTITAKICTDIRKLRQHTAVTGKDVQRKRKAYATIPKGSMGLSEESVHLL